MFQMWMNNGSIVTSLVDTNTGDVDRIFIDKSLVGKLITETVTDSTFYLYDFVQFIKLHSSYRITFYT